MKAAVLLVDDDPTIRRALAQRLGHWGLRVEEAEGGEAALAAARRTVFDLVLLDLAMPGISGMDVLRKLKGDGYPADVVVLTAHGSVEAAVEALKAGAADFLQKPADFDLLKAVVDRSLERRRRERVTSALSERLESGASAVFSSGPVMTRVLDTATRAARSEATVLITGESGSGKQVLAELIHARSERRTGPFVYVNCVALSDDLIESALFGHEKGAFTGALARKEGRLEAAAGGTAFLDEIGDTSPRLQTKLLHFLETGEFERVGGTRSLSVDCRVIAATNRDLEAAIKAGTFREDLYYRLNVVRLEVPPLRDRREDIPVLAQAFLERFGRELKRPPLRLAARTDEILRGYRWPGNVRQLKNVMERLVVLAPGDTLTPDLLPPEVFAPPPATSPESGDLPLKEAEEQFRRSYIARALARSGGNQTKAAALLGLQRTFLSRLLAELGLRRSAAADAADGTDAPSPPGTD
jgi:DNA-binding NtrC family response regulator